MYIPATSTATVPTRSGGVWPIFRLDSIIEWPHSQSHYCSASRGGICWSRFWQLATESCGRHWQLATESCGRHWQLATESCGRHRQLAAESCGTLCYQCTGYCDALAKILPAGKTGLWAAGISSLEVQPRDAAGLVFSNESMQQP
jgi:hypothetical protein